MITSVDDEAVSKLAGEAGKNMSKKTATIIIVAVTLIIITGLLVFYFNYYGPSQTGSGQTATGEPIDSTGGFSTTGGTSNVTGEPETTTDISQPTPVGTNFSREAVIQQLTTEPTSGFTVFEQGTELVVRYVTRADGRVYETKLGSNLPVRLSNTTIPQIYEAWFGKTGNQIILRYNREAERVESFTATVSPKTSNPSEGELKGTFLPVNAKELVVSPDGNKIFYFLSDNAGSRGIVANIDGSKPTQIFTSTLTEWQTAWPRGSAITLTTKPSAGVNGFAFTLNPTTGVFSKLVSKVLGLTVLENPSSNKILVGESSENKTTLKLFDTNSTQFTNLGLQTLPEKCVWSKKTAQVAFCAVPSTLPNGSYPDSWYLGLVSFSDELWKIDSATGRTSILPIFLGATGEFDITNLVLSPDESRVFFLNKKDLTLWTVKLASTI